jgi:hypothetical protein
VNTQEQEFLNLPFRQKLEFLHGLSARQRRDLILSAPEAQRLVRSFSPETLFYTLKEIGIADAGDLLGLAHPEQVKWLVDLDCWQRDRVDLKRMAEWIEALAESGRQQLMDALMELDQELVALWLRAYVRVYRVDDPQGLGEVTSERFIHFDDHYLIELIRDDPVAAHLLEFVEEAFQRDYTYFTGLMEETYWGLEAELEERAYALRGTRLADRGFPDFFEAQSVFAYLNPAEFERIRATHVRPIRADVFGSNGLATPALALTPAGDRSSFFNLALNAGFDQEAQRELRIEMALVANQVLVARAVDLGDPEAIKETAQLTHNYLNLGLEHLAAGSLEEAVEHLRRTHLKLLFRLGLSLTVDLRTRAQAVVSALGLEPRAGLAVPYLDSPYREALAGFLERRPRFFCGLEGARGSIESRDFEAVRDLHLAHRALDQVEAIPALFKRLLGIDVAGPSFRAGVAGRAVTLSQLLLTALARAEVDGRLEPAPLAAGQLGKVYAAVMRAGGPPARLDARFVARVEERLGAALDCDSLSRSRQFVDSCLSLLEEDLAELSPKALPDPRFIRSLLVRPD